MKKNNTIVSDIAKLSCYNRYCYSTYGDNDKNFSQKYNIVSRKL